MPFHTYTIKTIRHNHHYIKHESLRRDVLIIGYQRRTRTIRRDIFPFFDLPRELRDMVFAILLTVTVTEVARNGLSIDRNNLPQTQFLTISHQFTAEYLTSGTLEISDTRLNYPRATAIEVPNVALLSHILNLNICSGPRISSQINYNQPWVQDVLRQMKHINGIRIQINLIDTTSPSACCEQLIKSEYWLKLFALTSLEIFHCSEDKLYEFDDKSRVPVLWWSRERKKMVTSKLSIHAAETSKYEAEESK